MSPFSPFLGEGSLNGREKRTNRAALLFSDSSGTVQSLASRDSMRRARPILTGFNSVFEGEKSLGPEQRQREREKGGGSMNARHAFKINSIRRCSNAPRLVAFDTLETRYVVVYNEN